MKRVLGEKVEQVIVGSGMTSAGVVDDSRKMGN